MYFTAQDIDKLDHIYKIYFVNSLISYKPTNLITTKSHEGISKVVLFSSMLQYGLALPILGFVLRPNIVLRNTCKNIKDAVVYAINHITQSMVDDTHNALAKYPHNVSEFSKTNLDEEFISNVFPPFVKQAPVKIAMKFLEEYFIKANDTILILGEITDVFVNDDTLAEDGFVEFTKSKTTSIAGLDGYSVSESNKRFGYQCPV